jgi:polysaccharide export outer membrane protein
MSKILTNIFIITLFVVLSGCMNSQPNLPEDFTSQGPSVLVESYLMAVGDRVSINVWKNPELSTSAPIRPDGKISLPLVGDVMAVGRTPEEMAAVIEGKLSNYIRSPNVTVILTSLQGHEFLSRIRVTGSVSNNMSLTYNQGMTVLDAILEAGSVDLYADANNTKLHRRTEEGNATYDIRLQDIMQNGDMSTNVTLMPGDVITVPERSF